MTALNHVGNDYAARLANQARTPEAFKTDPRIYFHHHNHAKFHFDLGGSSVKSVTFANFKYITDDKREQDQLDLVADVPGTFIYTIQNSEVERAMILEIQNEATRDIMRTSLAQAAVAGQVFDPNAPVIPVATNGVSVQHMQPSAVNVQPVHAQQVAAAVVGLQHSFSGSQANESITATATKAGEQTAAPTAASLALEALRGL